MTEAALWRVATRTVLFTVAVLLGLYLLYELRAVMVQLLLAVIIAAGMTPLVDRLSAMGGATAGAGGARRRRMPRPVAVLLVYLTLLGAIVALVAAIVPPAASQVRELGRDAPRYLRELEGWLDELAARYRIVPPGLGQSIPEQLQGGVVQLGGAVTQALVALGVLLEALQGVLNFIFILFLALYLTTDSDRIRRYAISFLPSERRPQAEVVTGHIGDRLGGWVRGQITLSAIIGAVSLVGLLVIGVPYAVLLALVAAIGEAVPMIGPILSAVPAVIVAFFVSPVKGLLTIGLYIIVQQLENVLIVPKVMERAVSLHPLAVMMALLIGGELYGVTGAILSIPVTAAISVVLNEMRREWREGMEPAGAGEGGSGRAARGGGEGAEGGRGADEVGSAAV